MTKFKKSAVSALFATLSFGTILWGAKVGEQKSKKASERFGLELGVEDKFSRQGRFKGLAEAWHLDVKKKNVVPSLSTDCVSKPYSQKFELSPTKGSTATAYLMSGGRRRGSRDDFIGVIPGRVYELKFMAKTIGDCSAKCSLMMFEGSKWSSKNIRSNSYVAMQSQDWKEYTYFLRIPEKANAAIVHFTIKGGKGALFIDDFKMKEISVDKMPVDGNKNQAGILPRQRKLKKLKAKKNCETIPHNSKGYAILPVKKVPTICYNGKPMFSQLFFNGTWNHEKVQSDQAKDFIKAGIDGVFMASALDWGPEFASGGISDYGKPYLNLDKRIRKALEMNPKANFMLNIHMNVPKSWFHKHQDEMLKAYDGTRIDLGKRNSGAVSFVSKLCRRESSKRLKKLIRFIDKQEYADSVMGFIMFFGQSGEWNWFKPGAGIPDRVRLGDIMTDHSKANTDAFRDWLKKNYKNDIASLNKAWGVNISEFDKATVPKDDELKRMKGPLFNDPLQNRKALDYWNYYSIERTETLLYFAREAKKTTKIPRLVGAYYGAGIYGTVGGAKNILRGGGGGFQHVINSPYIDFLCNPNFYTIENVGEHCPTQNLVDSIYLHGKFHFFEYDHPTSTGDFDDKKNGFATHNKKRAPKSLRESVAVMKRDFSWAFCKNMGIWWWEMGRQTSAGSWFNAPEILKALASFQKIGNDSLSKDRVSVSEIAVVYSPESFRALTPVEGGLGRDLVTKQLDAFGKIGAPYDLYHMEDIKKARPYKLYIFWNSFLMCDEDREAIRNVLKENKATALWIYAPGYSDIEKGKSVENMEKLTGIKFKANDGNSWPRVAITNPYHPISKKFHGTTVGLEQMINPEFNVVDKDAAILGRAELSGNPAFAIKDFPDWSSIYIGAYPLSPALIRSVSEYAGVHIYNNADDVLAVNKSYFSIHSTTPGKKKIKLPLKANVYDLFDNKSVVENSSEFDVEITGPDTKLFLISAPGKNK